ncbi:MAG: helix-turn-helix domain-containing protein [Okeania sp. SIO3C4]|nr:helix-turn-helix domain-containing protein [Okeania sp. SIO3C4]
MGDGRHQNRGAKPLLDEQQQALLVQALEGKPPGGGRWSGPKVAVWMSELLGGPVSPRARMGISTRARIQNQSTSPGSCFSF